MLETNKNTNSSSKSNDNYIPSISLYYAQPLDVHQIHEDGIDVAIGTKIPFGIEEVNIEEHRIQALKFAWWFELLEKKLKEHSPHPESVVIHFLSTDRLVYSGILDCSSFEDAQKLTPALEKAVLEELEEKLQEASYKYEIDCLMPG